VLLLIAAATAASSPLVPAGRAADSFPKPQGYVNDYAGVLPEATRARLESFLSRVDQEFGVQLTVATFQDIGGDDPTDYANRLFEAWGVGNKKTDKGILLLDVVSQRQVRVEVGYGLEGVLPDGKVGGILDQYIKPYLQENRPDLAYVAGAIGLLTPVLKEMGRDPSELEAMFQSSGHQGERPVRRSRRPFGGLGLIPLILIFALLSRRRGGLLPFLLLMSMGGRGGFGGMGGFGGGGGFGGFGGGMSGGGGAGRGY
jgi:uncharacterized protein